MVTSNIFFRYYEVYHISNNGTFLVLAFCYGTSNKAPYFHCSLSDLRFQQESDQLETSAQMALRAEVQVYKTGQLWNKALRVS